MTSGSQYSPILTAAALSASLVFSGCAVGGGDVLKLENPDDVVTQSVTLPAKAEGLAETDAEIIKATVAGAATEPSVQPLAWTNPETGSSGSIVAIDNFMGKHGQSCRGFKTSVATFRGVGLYNGEACKAGPDSWVLSWFRPADAN